MTLMSNPSTPQGTNELADILKRRKKLKNRVKARRRRDKTARKKNRR